MNLKTTLNVNQNVIIIYNNTFYKATVRLIKTFTSQDSETTNLLTSFIYVADVYRENGSIFDFNIIEEYIGVKVFTTSANINSHIIALDLLDEFGTIDAPKSAPIDDIALDNELINIGTKDTEAKYGE